MLGERPRRKGPAVKIETPIHGPGNQASSRSPIPPWAEALVRLLDRALVIPGTRIPIGLDALLGLIAPGAGDAATGLATLTLFFLAFKLRVPKVILLRMLVNVGVDAVFGIIPVLGDVFDVFYRAGDRNLWLLKKYGGDRRTSPGVGDYMVVLLAVLLVLVLIALPFITGLFLIQLAVEWLS
jgi:hypothetical protein